MPDPKPMCLLLLLLMATALHAQTKCPPLPEGATCDHFHYHVSVWNLETRTYDEIAATRRFVTSAACEKGRSGAQRENGALVALVKTAKVDSSMLVNRYGDCHCDRTEERSSTAFLDPAARMAQLRIQQSAGWSLRERLLSRQSAGGADQTTIIFGHPPAVDRFLRETWPPPLPKTTAVRASSALLDTIVKPQPATPVAASLSLAPLIVPASSSGTMPTEPTVPKPPAPVPTETLPPSTDTRGNR